MLIETLHERGVVDKTHFAHAFARALDTLAPEHRGGMIEHVLRNMRDRCMNLPRGRAVRRPEWLRQFLDHEVHDRAARPGYLHATLFNRDTPGEMREFLIAVSAACRKNASSKILLVVRRARADVQARGLAAAPAMSLSW